MISEKIKKLKLISTDFDSKSEKTEKLKSVFFDESCQSPTSIAEESFEEGNTLKHMPSGEYIPRHSL